MEPNFGSRDRPLASDGGAAAVVAAVSLGVAGLLMATGGALHAHVPEGTATEMNAVASAPLWSAAHWTLTLAQALAVVGVVLVADRLAASFGRGGLLLGGTVAVALGLAVGVLGTLTAATGLREAALAGDVERFRVWNAFTLGLGWTCLAVTSAGGVLLGTHLAFIRGPLLSLRAIGWGVLVGSAAFVAAAALFPPQHPWTHAYVLRFGAVLTGLLLIGLATWLAQAHWSGVLASATGRTRA